MITQYDVIKMLNNTESNFEYDEESKSVLDENGKFVITIENYTDLVRKELNCSFESLFCCSGSLLNVLKCTECKTVIFSYDDSRYDPDLKCPICSDEETDFDYWTKEDIESDEKKRNTLKFYDDWNKRMDKVYKRQEKTGLYNDELWKRRVEKENVTYIYKLRVFDYVESKIRGLNFRREVVEDGIYKGNRQYTIPLGFVYIYAMYLYPLFRKIKKK